MLKYHVFHMRIFLTMPLITAIHLLKQVISCFSLIVCEFFFFNAGISLSVRYLTA